jgi:hypothetical protein
VSIGLTEQDVFAIFAGVILFLLALVIFSAWRVVRSYLHRSRSKQFDLSSSVAAAWESRFVSRLRGEANRIRFLALVGACLPVLTFCGPKEPPRVRSDLYFGYYGDCPACISETANHASFQWIAGWGGPGGQIERIVDRATRAAPNRTVIMLPGMYKHGVVDPAGVAAATAIFTGMQASGVLGNVVAVYPQDEPDFLGLTDQTVTDGNAAVRRVMAEFPGLDRVPLAVIYGGGSGKRPGIASYDWVGIDQYGIGDRVLGKPLQELKRLLGPKQRVLLVPGGAEPWKQDPAPFFRNASADPQTVGIVAFIWFDSAAPGVGKGIRSLTIGDQYRQLGGQAHGPQRAR